MMVDEFNKTQIANSIFSCIQEIKLRFGVNYITAVLVGSKSQKILKYGHDKLKNYGALSAYSFDQVKFWINELIEQEYLEKTKDEYPVLRVLDQATLAQIEKQEVSLKDPDPSLARKWALTPKGESVKKTVELFKAGKTVSEIATERNLAQVTILNHLASAYGDGEEIDINQFVESQKQAVIEESFKKLGTDYLSPVKQSLGQAYSWEDLKWVKAKIMREQAAI